MSDKTGLELGATINVGNYSSIKVLVWAEHPINGDIPAAQAILYLQLMQELNDKLGRLLTDLHEKGWVRQL